MIKSPQYWAGKLLGFYEAGDHLLNWLNALDTEDMTVKDFRSALVHEILQMKLKVK